MYVEKFLDYSKLIIERLNSSNIEDMVRVLRTTRESGGRLFIIGSGGGAGNASHAACDFRKLGGFEAYCPTDNVSELTARINDDGWDTSITNYLKGSRLNSDDCIFVFSVGGGNEKKNISTNLVNALRLAKSVKAKIVGVVGRDGGFTAENADACVVIPIVESNLVTPFTEAFQALIWHLIVTHPDILVGELKWESTE